MKILIIHNILWAHYKSVFFQEMSSNLGENDELHVVHIAKNELSRRNMETQTTHYNYPQTVLFDDYIEHISAIKKTIALFIFIYKNKPDVVNVTGYAVDISISLSVFFAKILGKKVILSNESIQSPTPENFLKKTLKKLIVKAADGFICFGTLAKDYMIALGAKPSQILEDKAAIVDDEAIYLNYTVELANQKLASKIMKKHNFIFVGRFIQEKNIQLLIETFSRLKNELKDADEWGLILLGDGNLKNEFEKQILSENIEDIQILPSVAWFEVPEYFAHANVFVLPSSFEPWGLVVNEAMICGLPVIVSENCGCAIDLVKGNGYSITLKEKNSLFDAMKSMFNESIRIEMGQKSKEIIANYKVKTVAKRLIERITA